ncbi:MAG: carboxypeptidase regulatory-like domain-containing protein, partial [bacterium]|nr:carboxypeptidase regulatory-like domain-containing protein [bacterium]
VGLSLSSAGATVTSQSDGVAIFTGIAAGAYTLGIGAPSGRSDLGYISNDSVTLTIGTTMERTVTLPRRESSSWGDCTTPRGTLPSGNAGFRVTVRDVYGDAVSGATIGFNRSGGSPGICVVTNSAGVYAFSNIASGTYVLGVSSPSGRTDFGYVPDDSVVLTGGTTVERTVTLPRREGSGGGGGGTDGTLPVGNAGLRVTVRDAAGAAVPGAMVGLSLASGGGMGVTTNTSGVSEFSGVASGTYVLGVGAPSGRSDLGYIANDSVTLVAGTTVERTMTLPNRTTDITIGTATLRVIVHDTFGKPVIGATVGITFPGGGVASPGVTVDASGIATFLKIAAGTYHLGVSPPANRADLGSVTAFPIALAIGATREETVVLPMRTKKEPVDVATICGAVYDQNRNGMSDVVVGISSLGKVPEVSTSATTDGKGAYCIKNLVPGTYRIGVSKPAHRLDLLQPEMVKLSLAAGTRASQDFVMRTAIVPLPLETP